MAAVQNNKKFEIIEFVVEYLPLKDLCNVSQVCKSWNKIVEKVKKNRVKTECNILSCSSLFKSGTLFEKLFKNCNIKYKNDKSHELCFIFMDFKIYELHAKFLIKTLKHQNFVDFHTIPKLTSDRLHQYLPQNCKSLILKCMNMVGTDNDGRRTHECESYDDNYSITSTIIPKSNGLTSHRFSIGTDMFNTNYNQILELKHDEKIKLILLTGYGLDKEKAMDYTLKCIAKEHLETFCYVNIIQPEMYLFGENHEEPNKIEGVVFTGEKVHATSVVIPVDDFSCVDTEEEIKKLKLEQFQCDKDKSLAFIFMNRDEKTFHSVNEIIFLLNKYFPGTPVMGMDTLKVTGMEHLGPENAKDYLFRTSSASSELVTHPWATTATPSFNRNNSFQNFSSNISSLSLQENDTSMVIVLLWW